MEIKKLQGLMFDDRMRKILLYVKKGRIIMNFGELFLLAVGLSMDAFAVSICKGLAMKKADAN